MQGTAAAVSLFGEASAETVMLVKQQLHSRNLKQRLRFPSAAYP